MRAPIVHHPAYTVQLPAAHRFPMRKYAALMAYLTGTGLALPAQIAEPRPAPPVWLALVHAPSYVSAVLEQRLDPEAERRLGLPLSAELAMRSRAATAGTVLAARLALEHGIACNTAGGSHHAFAEGGAGFCVFNDVAVAASLLLAEGSVHRVLVIDLDVHQGDGTAAVFDGDPRVVTFSVHCRTNFPARKRQSDVDIALDPGTTDDDYLTALDRVLAPLLDRVQPDLAFLNAGVDPHVDDRLGRLALSDAGLAERERLVLGACRARGVALACVVGGGYAPTVESLVARHAILFEAVRALPGW